MSHLSTSIARLFLAMTSLMLYVTLSGQDNTPPVITVPAQNLSVGCSFANTSNSLTTWYNNHAGAMATDNSGSVTFMAQPPLDEVMDMFDASIDSLCGHTRSVRVDFIAVDATGNQSVPTSATFSTVDNIIPVIESKPVDVTVNCTSNVRDSLINWIKSYGHAVASDQCSDSVYWTSFATSLPPAGTFPIATGPYPTIPSSKCNLSINVTFFVNDECGNTAATSGVFTIIDNKGPVFDTLPPDITISCSQLTSPPTLVAVDACFGETFVTYSEIISQDPDSSKCEHYNYEIRRLWQTSDICGNVGSHRQLITVRDLAGPSILVQNPLTIDCDGVLPENFLNNIDSLFDDCTDNPTITYTDQGQTAECQYSVTRIYVAEDICGNSTSQLQTLLVKDKKAPVITVPARDSVFSCDIDMDFNAAFDNWLKDFGGSRSEDDCSDLKQFASVPGSYDVNVPSTFPGQSPGSFNPSNCPSQLDGYLRYEIVDFLHIDQCQNISVTSAIFGIIDTSDPIINGCPSNRTIALEQNECDVTIKELFPSATDNCTASSSPLRKKIAQSVTSSNPGNPEIVVDTVIFQIGPFNTNTFDPLAAPMFVFQMENIDADDATEYFNIFNEDGVNLGKTPPTVQQCGDTTFVITNQSLSDLERWLEDGFITFTFAPNHPETSGVLGINAVCTSARITAEVIIDINPINVLSTYYTVNNGSAVSSTISDSISLNVSVGTNIVTYFFEDCAKNIALCQQTIQVTDQLPPVINCGDTLNFALTLDSCSLEATIPTGLEIDENCKLSEAYNQTQPTSDEGQLIIFEYDIAAETHLATNRLFQFENVRPLLYGDIATLTVEINGDINDSGEAFELIGEGGYQIGFTENNVSSSPCGYSIVSFDIDKTIFNDWAEDRIINILASAPFGFVDGGGINPCSDISPESTTDGESFLRATLVYYDANVSYSINSDTTLFQVPQGKDSITVLFQEGPNNIQFYVSDLGGNTASCIKIINLNDQQKPEAKCKDGLVEVHPSGLISSVVIADSIDNGSFDNCTLANTIVISDTLQCNDIGSQVTAQLIVFDRQGNSDTCIANITVASYQMRPSFIAGICNDDTLKLFANLPIGPINATYGFEWYKNGILFSTEENPTIANNSSELSGEYKVVVTGFGGCVSEGSVTVNIVPLTKPSINSNLNSICSGETVMLESTIFSGQIVYSWYAGESPTGVLLGTSSTGSFQVSPTMIQKTFYVVANNTDCETPPSESIAIDVFTKPVAMVTNGFLTVCDGEPISLMSSNTDSTLTYKWAGPNNYTSDLKTPPTFQASNAIQGVYQLIVSKGQCNSDTAFVSISVLARPDTPVITGEMIYCKGSTFSLAVNNVTNGSTYMWYKNGLLFRTTQDNTLDVPNAQTDLTGDWSVIIVRDGCNSLASQLIPVTVDDLINVGADNSGPVCLGDSVTLNATFVPNATYQWSGPNFTGSGQSIKVPSVAGDYSVTITTATLCSNIATTEVKVTTPPAITALSSDNPGCVDDDAIINFFPTIFPGGQYIYEWTGPNGYTNNIVNPSLTDLSPADTGKYTLTVLSEGCASTPSSLDIKFGISPATPTISAPNTLCLGEPLQITSSEMAQAYQWNTPTGIFTTNSNVYNIPSVTGLHKGQYKLLLLNGQCASDTSNTLVIDVKSVPIAPQITGKNEYCYNEEIILTTSIIGADSYTWTLPDNTTITNDSIIISNATNEHEGVYQLTYELEGCPSFTSEMFLITVQDSIITPSFLDKTLSLCSDLQESIEICLDPNHLNAGTTYRLINTTSNNTIATTNGICFNISDPTALTLGSNELVVIGENNGCSSRMSESVIVIFQTPPSIIANAVDNLIIACTGEDFINLDAAQGPPEVEVLWTALTPSISIGTPNSKSTVANGFLPGENLVKLSYSKDGCNNFSNDTVRIFLEPAPIIVDDNFNIEINKATNIDIFLNDQIPINSTISVSEVNNGTLKKNGSLYTFTPTIGSAGSTTFTYEACVDGCPDLCRTGIVTLNVGLDADCILPSIITPNQDGINDQLIIPCLETNRYSSNRLFVFNEWGDEVFYAKPYDNSWDGTYGGQQLPVGTYFIVFEPGNGKAPIRGFLTLQR